MSNETIPLSEMIPLRTAGALPSQRTKDALLTQALESDNIDLVKALMTHVWHHYESLELMLHDRESHKEMFEKINAGIEAGAYDLDVSRDEMFIGYMATGLIENAYTLSHQAGGMADLMGITPQDALPKLAFGNLDFSDPERELTDDELAALSGQVEPVETDDVDGEDTK